MRIAEIVAEPLRIHGVPRPEWNARVRAAMAGVELDTRFLDRLPHRLSGGERQRVALARAVVLEPRFIVTDEPTSLLDAPLRAEILALLDGLRTRYGASILHVTHDRVSASGLCDRILSLSEGRVRETG